MSLVRDNDGHTREHCHGHRIYSGISYTAALSRVTYLSTLTIPAVKQTSQHDTVSLVGAVVGGTNFPVLTRHDATDILTQPIIAKKLTFKSDALLLKLAVKCFSSRNTLILLTNEHRIFTILGTTVVLFTALKKPLIDKLKHQCCHLRRPDLNAVPCNPPWGSHTKCPRPAPCQPRDKPCLGCWSILASWEQTRSSSPPPRAECSD